MGTFNVYNVKTDYSAAGNGMTDDTTSIQNAINAAASTNGVVYFPDGTYKITSPLRLPVNGRISLTGNNCRGTIIKKTTNTNGSTPNRAARGGTVTDSFVVDSLLSIDHPDNDYGYNIIIENLTLQGHTTDNTYAIYAPRTAYLTIRNVISIDCNFGFFTYDSWLTIIEAFEVFTCTSALKYANDGSNAGTGTTLTATRVFANTSSIGYDIYGLVYSTFNSCGSDHITTAAYKFDVCHGITLNGCGTEDVTGEVLQFLYTEGVVNGFRTYDIDGVTGGTRAYLWFEASKVSLNGCRFENFVTPRDSYNMIVQTGATVTINQTMLPTGGNTFISYSSGSSVIHLDGSGVTCKTRLDTERVGLITNGVRIFYGTASPGSGTWTRGDVIYNTTPSAGGTIGWVCVTAGSPGTWKTFGAISA
ncbi:MAG: glycoside hydrolase family 55 protein [Ignavibacteriae bacterium]|nr:glycoside hydrolase family 55 protein [Ignavibacteriota bacterium]